MRKYVVTFLLVASCGGNNAAKDAASTEPANLHDSAPLQSCEAVHGTNVTMRRIAYGCSETGAPAQPNCIADVAMLVTSPPNDGRLFVVERDGPIRVIENETLEPAAFIDLASVPNIPELVSGGEQGVLGLAFHPNYANNGKFYVDYTGRNPVGGGDAFVDVVVEFTGGIADPNKADPASAKVILSMPDFASNHNGGMIEFGKDGFLYVATGDGGDAGDPRRNGQNTKALLAKILRLDVDHPGTDKPYGIPTDNPFADGSAGAPEVFIYGVRNPWRWSFDRMTGDMWIADVGQNQLEELNVLVTGQQAGKNLGWSAYEADRCCASAASDKCSQSGQQQPCDPTGKFVPQWQIDHNTGWLAIIGGEVYRGDCYPDLVGTYFFTDNNFGGLSTAKLQGDGSLVVTELTGDFPIGNGQDQNEGPSVIHGDARGELYEGTIRGAVWHIEVTP